MLISSINAIENTLKIDSNLGINDKISELQKDGVLPNNPLSTLTHEMIHWEEAEKYIAKHGAITIDNYKTYIQHINKTAELKLDKLQKSGYHINGISSYAHDKYNKGQFDEVYTEYKTLQKLGGA